MIKVMWTKKIKDELIKKNLLGNVEVVSEDENNLTVSFRKLGNDSKGVTYNLKKDYLRVVVDEKEEKAEIYLYGYIGQDFWWGDDELKEESITDLAFVRTLKDLESRFDRIDIRINSPGGSVYHGDPIITAIRNSSAEIHTYNDGLAASMGFDIWIAGNVRHMSINSKAMCHSTSTIEFGTAQDMREAAEKLDKFDEVAVKTFAAATDMSEEEIRERFYDYKDHWLIADEVKELGLIEEIEDYEVEDEADESKNLIDTIKAFIVATEEKPKEENKITANDLKRILDKEDNKEKVKVEIPEDYKCEITHNDNVIATMSREDLILAIKKKYGDDVSIAFGESDNTKEDTFYPSLDFREKQLRSRRKTY